MIDTFLGMRPAAASGFVSKAPTDDYWYMPRGADTVAGVHIDEDVAMTSITTMFACVAKVSKTVASLPLSMVEKTGPTTREPVDHWLLDLLDDSPNDDSDGLTFRESLEANLEAWGATYIAIDWKGTRQQEAGRLTLLPSREFPPGSIKRDDDGQLFYVWHPRGGGRETIPAERMWYIPGLSLNGVTGLSVVAYNREALGLSLVTSQFGNAFFGNGAWAGGFFEQSEGSPPLTEEKAERWLRSWNENFRGAKKAFGFGLLRDGWTFNQIDMPKEDLMFLGTRKFQRVEICGMFDVPPIMIHDDEHSTYNNTEQADIHFAKHSILPRAIRIEKSAKHRFFPGTKLSLKHNLAGLVRGDFKTRMEGYGIGRNWGLWSGNDCRAMEDMNPITGNDEYLSPLNMVPIGTVRPVPVGMGGDKSGAYRITGSGMRLLQRLVGEEHGGKTVDALTVLRPSIEHAAEVLARRQCKAATQAYRRHAKDGRLETFKEWAETFFDAHAKVARAEFEPILRAFEDANGCRLSVTAQDLADQMCDEFFDTIMAAAEDPSGIVGLLDSWKDGLAAGITKRLTTVLQGAEHLDEKEPTDA